MRGNFVLRHGNIKKKSKFGESINQKRETKLKKEVIEFDFFQI